MDLQTRKLVFFLVCIPVRSALAWLVWYNKSIYLSILIGLMGLGMIIRAIMRDSGKVPMKGFGGGDVYWNSYVHGILYISCAFLHYRGWKFAWSLLVADVLFGAITAAIHYFG